MQKIFSKEKYIKWCYKFSLPPTELEIGRRGWATKLDGLTEAEIGKLGYQTLKGWMEEVE